MKTKTVKKTARKTTPKKTTATRLPPTDKAPDSIREAQFVGFPIGQLERVLKAMHFALLKGASGGITLTETGFHMGETAEAVRELLRAVREAKSRYRPNPIDNPHDVVLIRDLAPIV